VAAGVVEAVGDQVLHALLAHVAERHRRAGWVRGLHLFVRVRFPYRRWLLLVILDLSSTTAVRTVVTVTYLATAVATWANLHCQRLSCCQPSRLREFVLPARHSVETGLLIARGPEVSAMQIAQQAAELAITDLITPHEQGFEELGEESNPLCRRQRPGEIGDGVCLSVAEQD
jgi:hypothetical protein